ncbi:MAG: hypothetical protein GY789_26385 [Hyphomicrobiales bacterium]|nr:hypothetical protein [Hyphomicrobiales bacterium]MCP4999645.1 hypothetical protein [Hyphomicrobiales bacterium]
MLARSIKAVLANEPTEKQKVDDFKMAGKSNCGRRQEKPFKDALRMEIATAGDDQKALRKIAAIREIADRLDGKSVQQNQLSGNLSLSHEEALEQLV